VSNGLNLPSELRIDVERWLDEIGASIGFIEAVGRGLDPGDASSLRDAIGDVRARTAFARRMFAGLVPLGSQPDDRWVPIAKPSRELAAVVHSAGEAFARTPVALLKRGSALLPADTYRAFSLEVAFVVASIFTNLTRAIWNEFPEYAPDGWQQST
jgi:hypothetical protein